MSKLQLTRKKKIKYIGGDNEYFLQAINVYLNEEYNKHFPNDECYPVNGEFVVHKEFQVKLNSQPRKKQIFGYVIQKVEKHTSAYTIIDGKSKKINDIEKFTRNQVKYMNDSYYELFFIYEGKSTNGDNFQNGAILEYTSASNNSSNIGPDDKTKTKGTINVKGVSVFIPAEKDEINIIISSINSNKNKMNISNNSNNNDTNTDKFINILGINWSLDSNTPANGLPYIKIINRTELNKIHNLVKSNILIHTVHVTWDSSKNDGLSNTESEII